ncbi:Major facilitator superfamily domain-containing protein 1 [Blattella germanica]|nr:Major facilitator superfamily domain-containing protein 1 [Blattella germanica]
MEGDFHSETNIIEATDEEEVKVPVVEDAELTGCAANPCCNPNHAVHRFLALMFMCLLGFGIVFGIRLGTIIYATLVVIGQIIFALGGIFDTFWLMVLGRFVFGIGGESLAVAQNNYAVLWFKGKELNMVFGLQLSFARVGSTVNFNVMGPLYKWVQQYYTGYMCIGVVLLIASATCFMSLLCAILLAIMDKRAERILKRKIAQDGEVVRLTDVKDFPAIFWLISVVCVAYYVAIFPFIALGKVFFERKFGFSPENANTLNSIVYIISAVASPLLGLVVDKVGKNVFWVFLSVLVSIGCHGLLAFTFINPYVAMIILGVAYSMLASALWPMVALVIPEYQLGTAYGIAQSVQNLGLAVITLAAGKIVDSSVALIMSVVIWLLDASGTGLLNMSPRQREVYESNRV